MVSTSLATLVIEFFACQAWSRNVRLVDRPVGGDLLPPRPAAQLLVRERRGSTGGFFAATGLGRRWTTGRGWVDMVVSPVASPMRGSARATAVAAASARTDARVRRIARRGTAQLDARARRPARAARSRAPRAPKPSTQLAHAGEHLGRLRHAERGADAPVGARRRASATGGRGARARRRRRAARTRRGACTVRGARADAEVALQPVGQVEVVAAARSARSPVASSVAHPVEREGPRRGAVDVAARRTTIAPPWRTQRVRVRRDARSPAPPSPSAALRGSGSAARARSATAWKRSSTSSLAVGVARAARRHVREALLEPRVARRVASHGRCARRGAARPARPAAARRRSRRRARSPAARRTRAARASSAYACVRRSGTVAPALARLDAPEVRAARRGPRPTRARSRSASSRR